MYRSPYDITPRPVEEKLQRDQIQFPDALPANSRQPFHNLDHTFTDRQYRNDRKQKDQLSVQNDYLQKYQINQLQQFNDGYNTMEQAQISRIMDKKMVSDGGQLDRNRDDAMLFGRQNPMITRDFTQMPLDTRREKFDLNTEREPMSKVLGAPPKFTRNI